MTKLTKNKLTVDLTLPYATQNKKSFYSKYTLTILRLPTVLLHVCDPACCRIRGAQHAAPMFAV